jgi:hypothetical protein
MENSPLEIQGFWEKVEIVERALGKEDERKTFVSGKSQKEIVVGICNRLCSIPYYPLWTLV